MHNILFNQEEFSFLSFFYDTNIETCGKKLFYLVSAFKYSTNIYINIFTVTIQDSVE